jgi:hypothetical protein
MDLQFDAAGGRGTIQAAAGTLTLHLPRPAREVLINGKKLSGARGYALKVPLKRGTMAVDIHSGPLGAVRP